MPNTWAMVGDKVIEIMSAEELSTVFDENM